MVDFILTIGSQRSGTTLMGQIIGAHPQAVLIDENDGLYDWTDSLFQGKPEVNSRRLFQRCCRSAMAKYKNPQVRFHEHGELRDPIKHVLLKAPNLTFSFHDITNVFSSAKIICMHRDIRDVVSSMMTLTGVPILKNQLRRIFACKYLELLFPDELAILKQEDSEDQVHIKMALVAKIKMSLTPQFRNNGLEVIHVKYEDLISNPEHEVPRILEKMDLPYAEESMVYEEVLQGLGPGGTRRNRPIDRESLGKWKHFLTGQQEYEIWSVVGDFMETLGYTR